MSLIKLTSALCRINFQLHEICKDNLDILLIIETRLHNSLPSAQFHVSGYCSPQRLVIYLMEVEFYYISETIYLQNF